MCTIYVNVFNLWAHLLLQTAVYLGGALLLIDLLRPLLPHIYTYTHTPTLMYMSKPGGGNVTAREPNPRPLGA